MALPRTHGRMGALLDLNLFKENKNKHLSLLTKICICFSGKPLACFIFIVLQNRPARSDQSFSKAELSRNSSRISIPFGVTQRLCSLILEPECLGLMLDSDT